MPSEDCFFRPCPFKLSLGYRMWRDELSWDVFQKVTRMWKNPEIKTWEEILSGNDGTFAEEDRSQDHHGCK